MMFVYADLMQFKLVQIQERPFQVYWGESCCANAPTFTLRLPNSHAVELETLTHKLTRSSVNPGLNDRMYCFEAIRFLILQFRQKGM